MLRHFNRIQLFATLRTVAFQAPLSVRFSTQDYGSGLPCPPPGDLPNPGTKPESLMSLQCQVGSLPLAPSVNPHLGIRKLQNHQSRKLVWETLPSLPIVEMELHFELQHIWGITRERNNCNQQNH